jgi:hypothetical protein
LLDLRSFFYFLFDFAYFYAHFVFKIMLLKFWGLVVPLVASKASPIAMLAKVTFHRFQPSMESICAS